MGLFGHGHGYNSAVVAVDDQAGSEIPFSRDEQRMMHEYLPDFAFVNHSSKKDHATMLAHWDLLFAQTKSTSQPASVATSAATTAAVVVAHSATAADSTTAAAGTTDTAVDANGATTTTLTSTSTPGTPTTTTQPATSPMVLLFDNFYKYLFELAPQVKPLFRSSMQVQGKALVRIIGSIKNMLQSPDLIAMASELAQRHVKYGIELPYFNVLGLALIKTLRSCSEELWTPETELAWRHVYGHVALIVVIELAKKTAAPRKSSLLTMLAPLSPSSRRASVTTETSSARHHDAEKDKPKTKDDTHATAAHEQQAHNFAGLNPNARCPVSGNRLKDVTPLTAAEATSAAGATDSEKDKPKTKDDTHATAAHEQQAHNFAGLNPNARCPVSGNRLKDVAPLTAAEATSAAGATDTHAQVHQNHDKNHDKNHKHNNNHSHSNTQNGNSPSRGSLSNISSWIFGSGGGNDNSGPSRWPLSWIFGGSGRNYSVAFVAADDHTSSEIPFSRDEQRMMHEYLPDFAFVNHSSKKSHSIMLTHWDLLFAQAKSQVSQSRMSTVSASTPRTPNKSGPSPMVLLFDNFYKYLFELAPQVKPLFRSSMQVQGKALMHIIGAIRNMLQSPDVVAVAAELAQRHVKYGIELSYFNVLGIALMKTLRSCSEELWTPETELAWRRVYGHVALIVVTELGKKMAALRKSSMMSLLSRSSRRTSVTAETSSRRFRLSATTETSTARRQDKSKDKDKTKTKTKTNDGLNPDAKCPVSGNHLRDVAPQTAAKETDDTEAQREHKQLGIRDVFASFTSWVVGMFHTRSSRYAIEDGATGK